MLRHVRVNTSADLMVERPDLLNAAAQGVYDVLALQRLNQIPKLTTGGIDTAQTIDGIVSRHFDSSRQQVHLSGFAQDLINSTVIGHNPGQTADYLLLDSDLYDDNLNFVFGSTWSEISLSVQSVARVVGATRNEADQRLHTRHIARHEFAHLRGLNQPSDYTKPDLRGGIYSGHCMDICTMRQSMTVQEALSQAKELEGHDLAGFCGSCATKLVEYKHK